jgi:ribonuclease VapC
MDPERVISAATYLETGAVIAGRRTSTRAETINFLDSFLASAGINVVAFDAAQARIALDARIRYGRGMGHGGKLNLGDAFSYALARSLDAPLLYVGDDFSTTDIISALS